MQTLYDFPATGGLEKVPPADGGINKHAFLNSPDVGQVGISKMGALSTNHTQRVNFMASGKKLTPSQGWKRNNTTTAVVIPSRCRSLIPI